MMYAKELKLRKSPLVRETPSAKESSAAAVAPSEAATAPPNGRLGLAGLKAAALARQKAA